MNNTLNLIYKAMDDKLAMDIVAIDFRNVSPFVDYFLIATARNARMAKSIIENVEDVANINNIPIKSISKNLESKWLLVDLGDIVCHIFFDNERENYNLEGLWKDLPIIQM